MMAAPSWSACAGATLQGSLASRLHLYQPGSSPRHLIRTVSWTAGRTSPAGLALRVRWQSGDRPQVTAAAAADSVDALPDLPVSSQDPPPPPPSDCAPSSWAWRRQQLVQIVVFTAPAMAIPLADPLMSLVGPPQPHWRPQQLRWLYHIHSASQHADPGL